MIIVVTHEFEFQHLETQDDIEQELELIQEVFGHNTGVDDLVRKFVHKHPSMGLKNFFTIKHRGRIVASLVLIPLEWSIGGVFL